jgi:hypothetical protein
MPFNKKEATELHNLYNKVKKQNAIDIKEELESSSRLETGDSTPLNCDTQDKQI